MASAVDSLTKGKVAEEVQKRSLLLFDVGNTLLHLNLPWIQKLLLKCDSPTPLSRLQKAEARAREAIDRSILESTSFDDTEKGILYFRVFFQTLEIDAKWFAFLRKELQERNRAFSLWSVLFPETETTLQQLKKKGKKLGIISNSDGQVKERLKRKRLDRYFELILDSFEVGVEKPSRSIFEQALHFFRKPPTESLYIGDLYSIDILGARNTDMVGILLDPYGFYRHPPCLEIASLSELLPLPS